jgi:DNA polymerase-3 subunit epsilon
MRQVVLDTETTGLEVSKGHRVIEIGCVELLNRRRTHRTFHRYIQPDRDIDPGAEEVHGITRQRLADEPRFPEIADEFLEFVSGAELIIHNADFDVGFLNSELKLAAIKKSKIAEYCAVVDTLSLARHLHPGQRNNLDALCKRYFVDNTGRDFHGALLDAQLLADVYLAMTGGQGALSLDAESELNSEGSGDHGHIDRAGVKLHVVRATAPELESHQRQLDLIEEASDEGAIWRKIDG